LRLRRCLLGMTQGDLAAAIGLTFQQVQKYEKAANRVSASMLHRIAGVLAVPVGFFFDDLSEDMTEGAVAATNDNVL
jgi:transcriptional regulator with XRE-family HTH domain